MSFAQVVKSAIGEVLAARPQLDLGNRECLVRNLIFVFHTMRASEHLLEVAIDQLSKWPPLPVREYFIKHLAEERQHEKWLAADLQTAGVDVRSTPINREAVELVGTQYYLIYHVHPIALLGYMAMTECFPVPSAVIDHLEASHGPDLLRTMRYHSVHDLDHGADIEQQLDLVPDPLRQLVFDSAVQSAKYFSAAAASFS